MITFVGGSPFSTSFASRHSWRVRQSDNYHDNDDFDDFMNDNYHGNDYNVDHDFEDFEDEDDYHDNKAD